MSAMEASGGAIWCKSIRHRLLVRATLSDVRVTHFTLASLAPLVSDDPHLEVGAWAPAVRLIEQERRHAGQVQLEKHQLARLT